MSYNFLVFSFQRTESVLKTTGEKTASVFGSITSGITSKLSQMKNSESMRSIEASVGTAYENVKVSYEQNNFLCQSNAVTTIFIINIYTQYISFILYGGVWLENNETNCFILISLHIY